MLGAVGLLLAMLTAQAHAQDNASANVIEIRIESWIAAHPP